VKVQERDSTVQDGKRPQTTVGSARSPMPGNGHTAQSTPTGSKLTKDKVYFASVREREGLRQSSSWIIRLTLSQYEEAYQDLNGKHQRLKKHAQDQAAELSELGHCYDDLNAGFDKLKIEKQTLTDELRALQTQSAGGVWKTSDKPSMLPRKLMPPQLGLCQVRTISQQTRFNTSEHHCGTS
jgi:hypothetical protein